MEATAAASIVTAPGLEGVLRSSTVLARAMGVPFAHAFASAGAIPVIAELNGERGHAVAEKIHATGGQALAIYTNVAEVESVKTMVAKAMRQYGRVDILVNNAAILDTQDAAVRRDPSGGVGGGDAGEHHRGVPRLRQAGMARVR